MRPKGAGAQLLLLALSHRADIALDQLASVVPVCPTGPDIAQAIRAGRAATGPATPRPPRGGLGDARRRKRGRAGFYPDCLGAVRPGDAPARLFPFSVAVLAEVF